MFKKPGLSSQMHNRPELSALQQLLTEALQNRGRQVQLTWRAPATGAFALVLICNVRGEPRWCLYREHQGKTDLLFDYSSCDVLLLMNMITTSVEPQRSTRSSFLGGKRAAVEEVSEAPQGPEAARLTADGIASAAHEAAATLSNSQAADSTFVSPAGATVSSISDVLQGAATGGTWPGQELVLQSRTIDQAAIQNVMTSLRHTDTGMFVFPAFLYFLEQEYFRSLRTRISLSVIVFEIGEQTPTETKVLPSAALVEVVMRITAIKRHVDMLSHFGDSQYAILLPNTRVAGARAFAQRMVATLKEKPLAQVSSDRLALHLGSACIPEDVMNMGSLLGAAELALAQTRVQGSSLVMYSDIKSKVKT